MENTGYTKLEKLKCIEEYFNNNFPLETRGETLNKDAIELREEYEQVEAFYLLYKNSLDPNSISKSE